MASVQERLKLKRVALDTWSTREQLCLASSVLKSGDQNWMSVSRSLRALVEKDVQRPPDWFSQKSCAIQYANLLENTDAPKRKKRESGETTGECIVRRLTQERVTELRQTLAFQRDEYHQLKEEINLLNSGTISNEKLHKMLQSIEEEERELEQKAKAYQAWLLKRQQKQDIKNVILNTSNVQKPMDKQLESQEINELIPEEDERKNKGGRSPLLTSLLKSPSPTTQTQTTNSTAQVTSPTIASLLGSSPKVPNPQTVQTVSSQIHQLVSTAIANTSNTLERPSAGAPTLSMLLEMPANAQRTSFTSVSSTVTASPHQTITTDVSISQQHQGQQITQSEVLPVVSPKIPVTESMVQIIDHIDEVIGKDIITDVMDKDEINEIIGDIEELIKEEITASPETSELVTPITAIENIVSQSKQIPIVIERPEPRDVDETVSLSNSPQSEIAIEEIDSSSSNIAEIIGTVAIDPKINSTIINISKEKSELETKQSIVKDSIVIDPSIENIHKTDEEGEIENITVEKTKIEILKIEHENSEIIEQKHKELQNIEEEIETQEINERIEIHKNDNLMKEEINKSQEISDQTRSDCSEDKKCESPVHMEDEKIIFTETENKDGLSENNIEEYSTPNMNEQNTENSQDVITCSDTAFECTNTEDMEKSSDITLVLEEEENPMDDEIQSKTKKESMDDINTNVSVELKEEMKEEDKIIVISQEMTEIIHENLEKEEIKEPLVDASVHIEDVKVKDEVEETNVNENFETEIIEQQDVIKKENESDEGNISDVSQTKKIISEIKHEVEEENSKKVKSSKFDEVSDKPELQLKEEIDVKSSTITESPIKKEVHESIGSIDDSNELDEEDTSCIKLSGRAMKTYSKKQNMAMDSEPENEVAGEGADYRAWKKAVMLVYNRLATHKYASVFLRPITEDQAPGYHSVIFRPMDLSTIKKNIDNGTIRSTMHFQRDVMLMFQNAIMYNKHDTFIYKMAISMQEECLQHMQILVQATGEGTFRRETRTAASSSNDSGDIIVKRKRSHIVTPNPHETDSTRSKKHRKSEND